jgi:hypothetical protein
MIVSLFWRERLVVKVMVMGSKVEDWGMNGRG